jgi:hypothetical protein
MAYIVLKGRWCNITLLNVHTPREEKKSEDSKENSYEKLEQVFDNFPKCHMKILLEILMQKWERKYFQTNKQE